MTTIINVDPKNFQGDYLVLDRGIPAARDEWEKLSHPNNSNEPFQLKSNEGAFHIRGGFRDSTFNFKIDSNGEIIPNSISKPDAARISSGSPTTLILQTTEIQIDANGYPGKYLPNLVSQKNKLWDAALSGNQTFHAIIDMALSVWNGSSRGANSVIATVSKTGAVNCLTPESAFGSSKKLTLRLSDLVVIPADQQVQISGYDQFTAPASPLQSVNKLVIRGLDTELIVHSSSPPATFVVRPLE